MRKISGFIAIILVIAYSADAGAYYGKRACNWPGFHCIKLKKYETGAKTWPLPRELTIIRKINRIRKWLNPEKTLLVPNDMKNKTYMDFSPFPKILKELKDNLMMRTFADGRNIFSDTIKKIPADEKVFIWNPGLLAWAAYDVNGNLANWGPGLGGKAYCPDIKRACRTPAGIFEALARKGYKYWSNLYPPGCKSAECSWMPYYVRVREDGLGLHGSKWFVGQHASHGCVRLFTEDAKWLNQKFFDYKIKDRPGTKIIFLPYPKR